MTFTIMSSEQYEAAFERIEELKGKLILDGPEAAELIALLAATKQWEEREIRPLEAAPPGRFAS